MSLPQRATGRCGFGKWGGANDQALRSVAMAPTAVTATPPNRSQIDLSVGVPVKKREASELNDCEALIPKRMSPTPMTNNTIPRVLFIMKCS